MGNAEENKIEIMMVQLLFKQKPKSPTTTQMREALERYMGDLGEIPYAETSKEMLVDTLGFYVFGGADVQVHFKNMDPDHVVNYVYNIASYQFDNDFPIESGETIDSLDADGRMQRSPQWKVQYVDSLLDPLRTVLDVNCGEFAGGNRG